MSDSTSTKAGRKKKHCPQFPYCTHTAKCTREKRGLPCHCSNRKVPGGG